MQDEDTLFAAVLIHSHSLAETAATGRLGASARDFGGIEDWGARLLAMNGAAWDSVIDGLAGAVESPSSGTHMRMAVAESTTAQRTGSAPSVRRTRAKATPWPWTTRR